jgi:hypothetical protein
VNTFEGRLTWFVYSKDTHSISISSKQEYVDFIREGPPGESVPVDVMIDLYEALLNAADDMLE